MVRCPKSGKPLQPERAITPEAILCVLGNVRASGAPLPIDSIAAATGYPPETVAAAATLLALEGHIKEGPSGSYSAREETRK